MVHIVRTARLLFCAALLAALPSYAVMTQLSANTGEVSDFAVVSNQVVFAATLGGGVYKSSNQGTSWARLTGLPAQYVNKLAGRDGQGAGTEVVYAATTVGVFRTTNGGTSWTLIYPNEATAVAVDPANSANVLIGVQGLGILRSTNGTTTATWVVTTGLDSTEVTSIVYDSTSVNVYASLYGNQVGKWGGVYKSTNSGGSWTAVNAGLPFVDPPTNAIQNRFVRNIAVDNQNNAYAALDFQIGVSGIWRLNAGTTTWVQVPTTQPFPGGQVVDPHWVMKAVHHDRGTPGRMWAGTGPYAVGFWRADNPRSGGPGFYYATQIDKTKFTVSNAFATFTGSANVLLVALNGLGVYKSTVSGMSLVGIFDLPINPSNTGLTADRVAAFAPAPTLTSTIYMGLLGGGVFKSTNSGTNWTEMNNGFESVLATPPPNLGGAGSLAAQNDRVFSTTNIAVSDTSANDVFAGQLGRGLFRSTNGGANWAPVFESGLANNPVNPGRNIRPRSIAIAPGGFVYYSIFDMPAPNGDPTKDMAGVYRRNGSGVWQRVVQPYLGGNAGAGKVIVAGSRYVALLNDVAPYASSDGINFGQLSSPQSQNPGNSIPDTGFARLYFYDITFKPGTPTTLVAASNKGVYRSTDSAQTFAPVAVSGPLTFTTFTAVGYSSAGILFAGTPDGKIFCSTNDGTSWAAKTLPGAWGNSQVKSIVLMGTTVYFLTDGNGVWQEASPACS